MTSLYDMLLPQVQAINEEGGNMISHLISKTILDIVDAALLRSSRLASAPV
jgi:hypothetical protein